MSRALAALAARAVGRRVRLGTGQVGTITRVTSRGFTVAVTGVRGDELTYLDD